MYLTSTGKFTIFLLGILCVFCSSIKVFAEDRLFVVPKDVTQVQLYLHTTGLGNELYTRGGHSAVRVVDPSQNLDRIYNWGMFDFGDPLFVFNFYLGNLWYLLGDYSFTHSKRIYAYDKRQVVEDELILNEDEKRIFLEKLSWNTRPENRKYLYKIFENNCSTKIRDYLNDAIGNELYSKTFENILEKSFRDEVDKALWDRSFLQFGLDILLNGDVDRKMNEWDAMFLPIYLRTSLISIGRIDLNRAKVIQNQELSLNQYLLIPYVLSAVLYMPFFLGILFLIWRGKLIEKLFRIIFCIFSVWTSAVSLVMISNWLFSFHEVLHHNFGLLVYWPFDFLIAYGILSKQHIMYRNYLVYCVFVKIVLIFVAEYIVAMPQTMDLHYLAINWAGFFSVIYLVYPRSKKELVE